MRHHRFLASALVAACALLSVGVFALGQPDDLAQRQFVHDGQTRTYYIVRPAATVGSPRPLVLVLHGGGGNGENAMRMTGFADKARREGFVAVFPEGSGRVGRLFTWNSGHCCGYAMQEKRDDVGFLRALVDTLVAEGIADPRRVYVTGMSNGAMMALVVAHALPERIAAIAPVVGGLFGDEPVPATRGSPVSVLAINGALDRSIPLAGGPTGGRFPAAWDGTPIAPVEAQTTFWARANGCAPEARVASEGRLVVREHACAPGVTVRGIVVSDGGHAWPGGQPGSRMGDTPSDALAATDVIWQFFADHPKPAAN